MLMHIQNYQKLLLMHKSHSLYWCYLLCFPGTSCPLEAYVTGAQKHCPIHKQCCANSLSQVVKDCYIADCR